MQTDNLPPKPSLDWAYFLDVDGTLLEIAENPNAVRVEQSLLRLLERLHRASGAVALISGRAISDLDRRIANRLPRAGQHGLERRDATGRLHLHATPTAAKDRIRAALAPWLERHPGLLLEDKGVTLALHYRQEPQLEEQMVELMTKLIADEAGEGLIMQKGKCVVEAKPANFDKGTAIEEFLAEAPFKGREPVFIGDDLNDEHGFALVNRVGGVSIKVGPEPTCARYRLPNVESVRTWLASALED